jgi:hypothetical protein
MLRYKESEKRGTGTSLDDRDRSKRIRCPRCKWQPDRRAQWQCNCGHVWNTFDTHGVCPKCHYAWRETRCLKCHQWSPHAEWYEKDL